MHLAGRGRSPKGPTAGGSIIELTKKRSADRTWWTELEWLRAKGYSSFLNGFDARWAGDSVVLSCRAGASEATLSLAAISDLLEAVPAEHWSALPRPGLPSLMYFIASPCESITVGKSGGGSLVQNFVVYFPLFTPSSYSGAR